MQPAEGGRDGPSVAFGPGYPASMRIPLRKLYLARMAAIYPALAASGVAVVYMLWRWSSLLALDPSMAPYGAVTVALIVVAALSIVGGGLPLIGFGLYYLASGGVRVAKGQTGLILDAGGYTDATTIQLMPVRIPWGNVRSIVTEANEGNPQSWVCVYLEDDSVYQSYSFFRRLMTHMTYMTFMSRVREEIRRRFLWREPDYRSMIEAGLLGRENVIVAIGLPVDAESLAALMNSYLSAWRRGHVMDSGPSGDSEEQ